jgi:hypothetical protein
VPVTQYQQTDTAALDGAEAACSGATLNSNTFTSQAQQGGTAGSTAHSVTTASPVTRAFAMFESPSGDPGLTSWPAGNWVVRLNVTAAAPLGTTLDSVYVCRVNSAGVSQATVGSNTNPGVALNSTGVKTVTVSGSAQTAGATDRWYIVLSYKTTASSGSFSIKFDQLIDTPFGAVDMSMLFGRRPKRRRRLGRRRRAPVLLAGHLVPFPPAQPPLLGGRRARRPKKTRPAPQLLAKANATQTGPGPMPAPLEQKARPRRRGKHVRGPAALLRKGGVLKSLTPALCAQAAVLEAVGGPLLVLEALAAAGLALEKLSAGALAAERLSAAPLAGPALAATATTMCP